MRPVKFLIVLFCAILVFQRLSAQKEASHWVFNRFGLVFQTDSIQVSNDFAQNFAQGMGVLSDSEGKLLCYSDGLRVWNAENLLMANGDTLVEIETLSYLLESLIVPWPEQDSLAIVFSLINSFNEENGLYYSIVNLNLDGGKGAVVSKGTKLIASCYGSITAVHHANKEDIWVIVQERETHDFHAFLVTEFGIQPEAISSQGAIPPLEDIRSNESFKISPDGACLALKRDFTETYGNRGLNIHGFELYHFDSNTGELNSFLEYPLPWTNSNFLGNMEFSSDGTKLYFLDKYLRIKDLIQLDLSLGDPELIKESAYPVYNLSIEDIFEMQLGPTGEVFLTKAFGGEPGEYLGIIRNPNAKSKDVIVDERGLYLAGNNSYRSNVPNFVQSYFFKTDFFPDQVCQGSPTTFRISNTKEIDSVFWSFGEGSNSKAFSPTITYIDTGNYEVELISFYPNRTDTIKRQVQINPVSLVDLGPDTTFCRGDRLVVEEGFASYAWSTGDTTRLTKAFHSGIYSIRVSNEFGCVSEDSIAVMAGPTQEIALPDSLISSYLTLENLYPGEFSSYLWSTGDTTSSIEVGRSSWYSVVVKDSAGCEANKSVYVGLPALESRKEWELLNPQPSFYPAYDMYFVTEEIGFIVNTREILKTEDGGRTWGVQQDIFGGSRITFHDNVGYIVGAFGSFYQSTYQGGGWNKRAIPTTDNLRSIQVIAQDTLIILGEDKLLFSYDAGQTWITKDIAGLRVKDAHFTSGFVGHLACRDGVILKTIDGGESWYATEEANIFPSDFIRIYFVNEQIGYATRDHFSLFKTEDGGESWVEISDFMDASTDMHFIDENTGFFVGRHGSTYKTTDGGVTLEEAAFAGRNGYNTLGSVFFLDENRGFAAGGSGRITRTLDGGETWFEYSPPYREIDFVSFPAEEKGYFTHGYDLYKVEKAKEEWEIRDIFSESGVLLTDFVNEEIGFLISFVRVRASHGRGIFKTTDGGLTWEQMTKEEAMPNDTEVYSMDFYDENLGFLSHEGKFGVKEVIKTVDGGATWTQVLTETLYQIQIVSPTVIYARSGAYSGKIYRSTDGGNSWEIIYELGDSFKEAPNFYFVNENLGFLVGPEGLLKKTIDGGTTWDDLVILPDLGRTQSFLDVQFLTNEIGYISEADGSLFKTFDGGETWEPFDLRLGGGSFQLGESHIYRYRSGGLILRCPLPFDSIATVNAIGLEELADRGATIGIDIESYSDSLEVVLEYGISEGNYSAGIVDTTLVGEGEQQANLYLEDLEDTTVYYVRVRVYSAGKLIQTEVFSFTTEGVLTHSLDEFALVSYRVYPNPAGKFIQVDLGSSTETIQVEIMDVQGRLQVEEKLKDGRVDISHLHPGVYLITLRSPTRSHTVKFLKK